MKKILYLTLAFLLICPVGKAQLAQDDSTQLPLPTIYGWQDNRHYVIVKKNLANQKWEAFSTHVNTGKETKVQRPERKTPQPVKETTPRFSPDGKWMAFTKENDLYAKNLATGKEIRYTHDGSETILNGYASWVYYEEILRRDSKHAAIWWSPDSKYIAFYRFDDSKVPIFPLYNATGQHGYTEKTRYPKAGDPNPEVKIGIVPVEGGDIVWSDFNPKEDQYFGTPFWRPDASGLIVQWMPREQNNLKLFEVSPTTGTSKEIYDEKYPTWINWIKKLTWVKDGFLMVRDYEGWEQIYYHHKDGRLKKKLTTGTNRNVNILKVDNKRNRIFYTSDAETATCTDLYTVNLDGKKLQRITFGNYNHGKFSFSPDGEYVITTYANSKTPPRLALINTVSHKTKVIADTKGPKFDNVSHKFPETVWIKSDDGLFDLPGRIRWPKNMKNEQKYPVIIRVYGGPNHPIVKEGWTPVSHMNEDGYIQMTIEHRGSGHNGKKGMDFLHRNLGKWEMTDYISWVKWLRQHPNVDPDKILINGGSYGGYIVAMALTYGAGYFQYGICEYPVIDWQLYDSHYTERYMDSPKDNPEGYKAASVLTYADNYQSKGKSMMLIQHGMMDDNVHVQNIMQLIDIWQKQNKTFELMIYPNERHGWRKKIPFTNGTREKFKEKYLFQNK